MSNSITPTKVYNQKDLASLYPEQSEYILEMPDNIVVYNNNKILKLYNRIGISEGIAYYKETSKFVTVKKGE